MPSQWWGSPLKCSKEGKFGVSRLGSGPAILLFTQRHLLPCVDKRAARLGTQSPLRGLKVSISSSSCAPDSSSSGTTDCTGRGPRGEKAPRGRETSRGQSSSGGSPIRLWGTGEFWSGGPFSSPHLQGQSQLLSRAQQKQKDSECKVLPLAGHLLKDFA